MRPPKAGVGAVICCGRTDAGIERRRQNHGERKGTERERERDTERENKRERERKRVVLVHGDHRRESVRSGLQAVVLYHVNGWSRHTVRMKECLGRQLEKGWIDPRWTKDEGQMADQKGVLSERMSDQDKAKKRKKGQVKRRQAGLEDMQSTHTHVVAVRKGVEVETRIYCTVLTRYCDCSGDAGQGRRRVE
ncbi:hypothetical protein BCV70DRAFT_38874 [Testicularia cyperi]|uniref:Uncharacterized protein n=1 Tax=Testicularia cyperi TaxID=1882483 RepID=A0A317XL17_9BASI|nr:hypothetical protein BCV70DRAFT_38874 [Testicularia cyperi]